MTILNVYSIKATGDEGVLDFDLTIYGMGRFKFTYVPGDTAPVTAEIAAWLQDHPGATIEPYAPPAEPTTLPILKPYQFWAIVRAGGYEERLRVWAGQLEMPLQQAVASAMLDYSLEFRRNHPMIEAARVYLELTESELDALWLQAAAL